MGLILASVGLALLFVMVEMSVTFLVAHRLRNYGIVDVVWSAGFTGLAFLYGGMAWWQGEGATLPIRSWILLGLVTFWSVRLAIHLGLRVQGHHPQEDIRYAELRREWGSRTTRRMFGFFHLQGVLQVILSLPFLLVLSSRPLPSETQTLSFAELCGAVVWGLGWFGESLADRQLSQFRKDPTNRGKVCQLGLWNYSRHPNYFFEWMIWVGFALFALGSPWGWLGFLSPLMMGHFLINVTGIPMTEAMSVKSKGDAYKQYQQTTNAFFPWFKKTKSKP